jgi:hypothetical protein
MDKKIMKRVMEHYDVIVGLGYECVGVFLYGSQNYKLDNEDSDVDTKAIVLPTFEDIVLNRHPISCEHVMKDGSHIDIKDIRLMFGEFKKANINFVELLFTEYNLINSKYSDILFPICEYNEKIARYKPLAALKCATGTATGKLKELEKKFNYKTASTILRLEDFCIDYIDGKNYLECITPTDLEFIKSVKDGSCIMSQVDIIKKCEYAVEHCKLLLEAYERFHKSEGNKEVDKLLNDVIAKILSEWLKEDIHNYEISKKTN